MQAVKPHMQNIEQEIKDPEFGGSKKKSLAELYSAFPIGQSTDYEIRIYRFTPKIHSGIRSEGHCETVHEAVFEDYISNKHGGGGYFIRVAGPRSDGAAGKQVYASTSVYIAGPPKLQSDGNAIQAPAQNRQAADENPSQVVKLADILVNSAKAEREERKAWESKAIEQLTSTSTKDNSNMDKVLDIIRDVTDKRVEDLKRSQERESEDRPMRMPFYPPQAPQQDSGKTAADLATAFGQVISAVMSGKNTGSSDADLLKSVTGQTQEQLRTLVESHRAKEESLIASHRMEMENVRAAYSKDLERVRESYENQIRTKDEIHSREVKDLRDFGARDREQGLRDTGRDRDALVKDHEREISTLKDTNTMQCETIRQSYNGQIEMLKNANETRISMLNQEITRLTAELQTTRMELSAAREKIQPTSTIDELNKYKTLKTLLGEFSDSGKDDAEPEDKLERIAGKILNSKVAERIVERFGGSAQREPEVTIRTVPQPRQIPQTGSRAPTRRPAAPVARPPQTVAPVPSPPAEEAPKVSSISGGEDLFRLLNAANSALSNGTEPATFASFISSKADQGMLRQLLSNPGGHDAIISDLEAAADQAGISGSLFTFAGRSYMRDVLIELEKQVK